MASKGHADARAPRVKNRAPAAIQITAEQLLREAHDRQEVQFRAPKQRVEDFEELNEYRGRKRKEFEERIRRARGKIREWQAYASWEASQGEFDRSRSVYERALDVDPKDISLWLSYTEMELKSRNVQHARNLFDRAVTLLPRITQLWYKYVYLEELLQNIPGARQVFERWMKWEPEDKAWQAYIKMEERYGELDRASAIYERWVAVRPEPRVWVKWGKFEEERGKLDKSREVFQMALEFFGDDEEQIEKAQAVFSAFARMETRLKEYERARVIYKFALSRLSRSKSVSLYNAYTKFEKQHGTRTGVEMTVLGKRRIQYEEELSHDGRNYDVWFDYARLEEEAYRSAKEEGDDVTPDKIREVYERAVAQIPPGQEKRLWRRYIFLWLYYALFEELETKDYERTRQIYKTAIEIVPHKLFTFAKLWLNFANFEIRRMDLQAARRVLGVSIGRCPKEALFKGYIEIEIQLREFDRVRTLYEKYIEFNPTNTRAWIAFASLENGLGDIDRCRAVYELAVDQPLLEMPETLWKAYIDFEAKVGRSRERARALYERMLEKTEHKKVWLSYALFESSKLPQEDADDDEEEEEEDEADQSDPDKARAVLERGYYSLRKQSREANLGEDAVLMLKIQRLELLKEWLQFEHKNGTAEQIAKVQEMMPSQETSLKWKPVDNAGNMQQYEDVDFPDDMRDSNPTTFKFLQTAMKWKQKLAAGQGPKIAEPEPSDKDDSENDDDEDDEDGEGDDDDGDSAKKPSPRTNGQDVEMGDGDGDSDGR